MKMLFAIPGLPVSDIEKSTAFYRDKLGFTVAVRKEGFAKLRRDAVEIHLWEAADEGWRTRVGSEPIVSGAESFIAGTGGCRVSVEGVEEWYRVVQPLGILHDNAQLEVTPWGTREFAVVDPDNNLVTFFERK
ncbi:MAG: bleomycin resistance protein [Gammaproteobacteria bacterium]